MKVIRITNTEPLRVEVELVDLGELVPLFDQPPAADAAALAPAPAPAPASATMSAPPAEPQPLENLDGSALTHRCGSRAKADAFRVWKALDSRNPWFNDPAGLERMERRGVRPPMSIARKGQWFTDKISILTGAGLAVRKGHAVYRENADDDTACALLREVRCEHGKKVTA